MSYLNYIQHVNTWFWGKTDTIVHKEGIATVELQLDDNYPAIAFVKGLLVYESNRKQGLGTEMLKLCEMIARGMGYKYLQLSADKTKDWLVAWYQKMGFEIICKDEHEYTMLKRIKE